jgi:putative ABC transport system substrate-binding protein
MAPLSVAGQAVSKTPRIGLLYFGDPSMATSRSSSGLFRGLRELGWLEGQNLTVERRFAEGRSERLPELAAELVRAQVNVLVPFGTDLGQVAKAATSTIPIVMAASADPVEKGLVSSFARPGGNLTGVAFMSPELSAKRLALISEVVPNLTRVAVLWDPSYSEHDYRELTRAARALNIELQSLEIRSGDDLEEAFRAAAKARVMALIITPSRQTLLHRQRIVDLAAVARLPAMGSYADFARSGSLMSYGPDPGESWRRAASHIDKILKGAKPADLPVERPTTFELVVNLKTAKALGLTIPPSILLRADEVVQ